jgi:hypothetical protein
MMLARKLAVLPLLGLLAALPALAQDDGEEGSADVMAAGATADDGSSGDTTSDDRETSSEDPEEVRARAEFHRDLRTVEQEVDHLKERVFRSKATLQLLKELVIEGASLGSRVVVWHINRMGPAYHTESIKYFLDGKNVYSKVDPTGHLGDLKELKIHEQAVPPGTHNLQVNMVLRGYGLGVFSYLKTYSFKVQSSYTFKVEDGKVTVVRVIADERSGPWRSFEERPTVQYEEKIEDLRQE